MCSGVLVVAIGESTTQPFGLLVVSMVLTPIIVAIFGGLPVDFLKSKLNMKVDNRLIANERTKKTTDQALK